MQKISSGEVFDYYETEVQLTDTMFVYLFRIKSESERALSYHRWWRIGTSGGILQFPDHAWIFHTGMGKRRSDVSNFCRPLL